MQLYRLLYWVIPALMVHNSAYTQRNKTIKVPLHTIIGSLPFNERFLPTAPLQEDINFDATKKFSGIPAGLTDTLIKQLDFQPEQGIYEYFLHARDKMPPGVLMKGLSMYHADTLQLSNTPIKHQLYFLSGKNKKGQQVIIADVNNNRNFSDDKTYVFDTTVNTGSGSQSAALTNIPMRFQYALNGKVYDKVCNLKASPFKTAFRYRDPTEQRLYLICILNEYRQGKLTLDGQHYTFQATSRHRSAVLFDSMHARIVIDGVTVQKESTQKEYMVGDTILLKNSSYRIAGISPFGDTLTLSFAGKAPAVYGIDAGKMAYNITGTSIDSTPFNLNSFKGKYVLLDFWGTWCQPCINSIPDLVNISQKFSNDVQIVSICYDRPENLPVLQNMITAKEMRWIHIFQNMSNPRQKAIIDQYRVENYPTQLLIDPQGKIISRIIGSQAGAQMTRQLNKLLPGAAGGN